MFLVFLHVAKPTLRGHLAFANRFGQSMTVANVGDNPWRRALVRAAVPYRSLYNFRHTYTSLMLAAGKPLQWVAHQLGHIGVRKIDEVYGRWVRIPDDHMLDLPTFFAEVQKVIALPKSSAVSPNLTHREAKVLRQARKIQRNRDFWCPGRESNPDLRFRRPP
jgi:hypothetical protein